MAFYLKQLLIAIDQLINAVFGGWADETLSSRAWREDRVYLTKAIDFVFGADHCWESYISERQRLQSPPEQRVCRN